MYAPLSTLCSTQAFAALPFLCYFPPCRSHLLLRAEPWGCSRCCPHPALSPCPAPLCGTGTLRGFTASVPPAALVPGTVTAVRARGAHVLFWQWLQLRLRGSSQHAAPHWHAWLPSVPLSSSQVWLGSAAKGRGWLCLITESEFIVLNPL